MFADPRDEFRVTSGEPPDDADRRKTGPASAPSEESEVSFLDEGKNASEDSLDPEPDADLPPGQSR